jgi:alkylation response protein AidB-like acyl-CoA dehydrogenase
LAHGTPQQVERLVPPRARGEELGAFALTESGGGSDAGAMRTRADAEGRLTGTKQWVTNGSHAGTFLAFAKDSERPSAFVLRDDAPGFAVTREEEKMGLNSSARALTWRAARLKQPGLPHTVEGAQAKLLASRVAREGTGEAIQVLGGYGTREFPPSATTATRRSPRSTRARERSGAS